MGVFSALESSPGIFYFTIALVSLMIGSFLNVVILRLPKMLERTWRQQCHELLDIKHKIDDEQVTNLIQPPSHCPHCKTKIKPLHNIPVVSYLWLKGRCGYCSKPINIRYPIVELITMILSMMVAWHFGVSLQLLLGLVFVWGLLTLSVIDIDHHLLPDSITLSLLWLGLTVNAFALFTDIHSALFGAIIGYVSLWLVFHLFKLATGKEGMGYGDFKLFACLGAWLGWQLLPIVILFASVVGVVVGLAMIALGNQQRSQPIPFGPFLCAAGFIALLWGKEITDAYLQYSGI